MRGFIQYCYNFVGATTDAALTQLASLPVKTPPCAAVAPAFLSQNKPHI